jgi:hypothetical protein
VVDRVRELLQQIEHGVNPAAAQQQLDDIFALKDKAVRPGKGGLPAFGARCRWAAWRLQEHAGCPGHGSLHL